MRKTAEIFAGAGTLCGFKVRTSRKKTAVGEGVRRSEGAVRPSAGPGPESADGRASALPGRPKTRRMRLAVGGMNFNIIG